MVPYEQRQQVLGRFLAGQMLGQLFGQAAGGVLGDQFGWRTVFFVLAAMFAIAAVALDLRARDQPRHARRSQARRRTRAAMATTRDRAAQPVGARHAAGGRPRRRVAEGVFPYVGADLHLRFGLSFTAIGLIIGVFAIGGLIYAATVQPLMHRLGQTGLATPAAC